MGVTIHRTGPHRTAPGPYQAGNDIISLWRRIKRRKTS